MFLSFTNTLQKEEKRALSSLTGSCPLVDGLLSTVLPHMASTTRPPRIAIEKKEKSRTPLGVMCYREFGNPITPPER
jgi:hypothetical protein